jgi:putative flippase GtrA
MSLGMAICYGKFGIIGLLNTLLQFKTFYMNREIGEASCTKRGF